MRRCTLIAQPLLLLLCALPTVAQWDKKPYTEWSEKETEKLLNDSPWGQTQALIDTTRMFDRDRRLASGESRIIDPAQVNFRIRFMSSKPIRQAISRSIEIKHKSEPNDKLSSQLKAFAAADFPDYIIVTVQVDTPNPNNDFQAAVATLNKLTTTDLRINTYLLTKDGKRIFLKEYQAPRNDGLGARFIFPRLVDGKPFITAESGEVLFYSDLGGLFIPQTVGERKAYALTMRYKVTDMMFNGKLEI